VKNRLFARVGTDATPPAGSVSLLANSKTDDSIPESAPIRSTTRTDAVRREKGAYFDTRK
jgi:hypothetical protein